MGPSEGVVVDYICDEPPLVPKNTLVPSHESFFLPSKRNDWSFVRLVIFVLVGFLINILVNFLGIKTEHFLLKHLDLLLNLKSVPVIVEGF